MFFPIHRIWHYRLLPAICLLATASLSSCASLDRDHEVLVSVPDQRMVVLRKGAPIAHYPVSTSKFGLGDMPGTYRTPIGRMEVAEKIGHGAPKGTVFKSRRPTGEILPVNAPGRDPIVTRIIWLRGLEEQNASAYRRFIYIHGTPEEINIGKPVSYGCIRMRSRDVIELYDTIGRGARVEIIDRPMRRILRDRRLLTVQNGSENGLLQEANGTPAEM